MKSPEYENDSIQTEAIIPDGELNGDSDISVTLLIDENANRIESGVSSVIGSRKGQQDAVRTDTESMYADNGVFLTVMCDGMGGLSGGEKASNLCVTKMFEAFYCVNVRGKAPSFLKFAVTNIDKMIHNMTDGNGVPIKTGSTLTAVIIEDNKLYWASVGDSRIYLKRGREMVQITVDHNYRMVLEEDVKQGKLTKEQADCDPQKDALVSYMGMGGLRYIDINPFPLTLKNGDCIMLCSDGLYRTLSDKEIKSIIDSFDNMQTAAEALTSAAISKGRKNQDNTTVALLKYIENKAYTAEDNC